MEFFVPHVNKLVQHREKKRKGGRKRVKRGRIGENIGKRERIGGGRWKGKRKREGKVGKPGGP